MSKKPRSKEANNKHQEEFVQRREGMGLKMIRNLWAPPENHEQIKNYAKSFWQKDKK